MRPMCTGPQHPHAESLLCATVACGPGCAGSAAASACVIEAMIPRSCSVVLSALLGVVLQAQPQHRYWYFGSNAGLDMSTEPPTALHDGMIVTDEGVTSIADADGQLLFYSNGVQVWDRTHAVMPGGGALDGHSSSSQSALIVPVPDDPQRYYLFTAPAQFTDGGTWGGLSYSEIDMTANGGLGAVVEANVHLMPSVTEKLTATRHANGRDIWVLVHGWNSDAYHAFLVTCAGISAPVTTHVGTPMLPDFTGGTTPAIGCMQVDPQGTRVAAAWQVFDPNFQGTAFMDVLRFDNTTGVLSDPVLVTHGGGQGQLSLGGYGVCFSPSGERLYLSEYGLQNEMAFSRIVQYTVTGADLPASEQVVATSERAYGTLQKAPDGTIYAARLNGADFLTRITAPDLAGMACNVVEEGVDLDGALSMFGLPNHWDTYPPIVPVTADLLRDTVICVGSTLVLDATVDGALSYTWNTGATTPTLSVDAAGTYSVEVVQGCEVLRDTAVVAMSGTPVDLGPDRLLCLDDSVRLMAPEGPDLLYAWSTGSAESGIIVGRAGNYSVQVFDPAGCVTHDTVHVASTNCACLLFAPNAFTPNDDGINDVFAPACDCTLRNYALTVYDRWGEAVFRSDEPGRGWNGTLGGAPVGPTLMAWRAEYEYFTGAGYKRAEAMGSVAVVR